MKLIDVADRAVFTHQLQHRRRRGRPRVAVPMVRTSVRLPEPVFDAACKRASDEGVSLPAVVRETLARELMSSTNHRRAVEW